jgi:hypothetical protein
MDFGLTGSDRQDFRSDRWNMIWRSDRQDFRSLVSRTMEFGLTGSDRQDFRSLASRSMDFGLTGSDRQDFRSLAFDPVQHPQITIPRFNSGPRSTVPAEADPLQGSRHRQSFGCLRKDCCLGAGILRILNINCDRTVLARLGGRG